MAQRRAANSSSGAGVGGTAVGSAVPDEHAAETASDTAMARVASAPA